MNDIVIGCISKTLYYWWRGIGYLFYKPPDDNYFIDSFVTFARRAPRRGAFESAQRLWAWFWLNVPELIDVCHIYDSCLSLQSCGICIQKMTREVNWDSWAHMQKQCSLSSHVGPEMHAADEREE